MNDLGGMANPTTEEGVVDQVIETVGLEIIADQVEVKVAPAQPFDASRLDLVLDPGDDVVSDIGVAHLALEPRTALTAERFETVAERGVLTEADSTRSGLGSGLPPIDAVLGDVLDDVLEVVVLDGFDELEGVIGDPAVATVDLEVAFGVGGRDHRILHHLEISCIKVRFLAKIGLPRVVLTTKTVGTYYHKITILSIYKL